MASDPADPAYDPDDLARQAGNPHASPGERQAALAALAPFVRAVATRCARRLNADEQVRRDLVDQSLAFLEERLHQFDPQRGCFPAWLAAVLTHRGQDLRRSWHRHASRHQPLADPDPVAASPPAVPVEQGLARLARAFGRLRQDLDAVGWPAGRGVDYHAVLLVFLRVEMVASCRRAGVARAPGEAVERVATWLPWRAEEEVRSFRPGLPTLADLWPRLASRLEQGNGLRTVLDALNTPPPGDGPVSYETLAQWSFRARKVGREKLGPQVWEEHGFARLLCPSSGEVS